MNTYAHLTITQQKAVETRNRRQAAGRYPTKAQRDAFARMVARGGYANLTLADMRQLANYPYFPKSQRDEWQRRADALEQAQAA